MSINTMNDLVEEVQALQEEQEHLMAEIQKLRDETQALLKPGVLPNTAQTIDPILVYLILRRH